MSARGRGSNAGVGGAVTGRNDRLIDLFSPLAPRVVISQPAMPEDLTWQDKALCAQVDPEIFFVDKGGSTAPAKKVCRSCEVRAACLEYALERGEPFGIFGGVSEQERRSLRRRFGRDTAAAVASVIPSAPQHREAAAA